MHGEWMRAALGCAPALAMFAIAIAIPSIGWAQPDPAPPVVSGPSRTQAPDTADEKAAAALARRTAADQLSIPVERVTLVRITPAEFRDSSLGCPQRGMVYMPVITDGYKVTLRDGAREHTVHVAGGRGVFCGSAGDPKQSPLPMLGASRQAGDAVRTALAAMLDVEDARVRIVSTRPASSPGAPPCADAPETPAGPAFIVEAVAMEQTYWYYVDEKTTRPCEALPRVGPRG